MVPAATSLGSGHSASPARIFNQTASQALVTCRCRWGGTAPRQPRPGTREAWPRRVCCSPALAAADKPVRLFDVLASPEDPGLGFPRAPCRLSAPIPALLDPVATASKRSSRSDAENCARANTPPCRLANAIHSARQPVQPKAASACSGPPPRWLSSAVSRLGSAGAPERAHPQAELLLRRLHGWNGERPVWEESIGRKCPECPCDQ